MIIWLNGLFLSLIIFVAAIVIGSLWDGLGWKGLVLLPLAVVVIPYLLGAYVAPVLFGGPILR